ncbi:SH3 domain-containing protein [Mesorhizobium sp. L2C084A000]|uniref:SH3 domain-containing protein n=1 Tax=unclassified Mesorhizobium TaxID=325217 RepID=UPI0003CFFC6A|nr:SH3 domain-containing protein [Mesorhizobium sp. L2C084A000]ESZ28825.1 peptide-binding protein [Mesorhizobium sp. L2C084A000]
MRRTVTLRTTLHALIAAPLLMTAWPVIAPAMAEEMAQEAPDLVISVVTGLAPDDLLKVRTTASPVATVEARLSSGDMVTNLGCNDINGYKWCKIESTGKEKLSGWAPARYLIPLNPAPYVEGETRPADSPVVASTGSANEAGQASAPDQSQATDRAPVAPPDLTARLGGAGPAVESTPKSAAEIGRAAMQDAYVLALAAPDVPLDSVPTPASGPEIPCARYVGQPMERCKVSVVHTADKANITVTWPDGGTRIISFRAGQPAGSDADGNFRFTREGSLNMIRIGEAERFEITDQLALGN